MIRSHWLSLVALAFFLFSCTASRKSVQDPAEELRGMQHVTLDPMIITPQDDDYMGEDAVPAYKPSRERVWDLLHTALDLSFDWKKEAVQGTATLTLTPVFYTQDALILDAVGFEIQDIMIDEKPVSAYTYDGAQLDIPLGKKYTRDDELTVVIRYTALPRPGRPDEGAAVKSDRGLFFIDPQDTIPGLPQQIWTQGETSNNRRWFPTLDQPNERATQEIILTVADTMRTLSNGLLVSSTPLPGGMRRDHWKLDLPHAPYLAMVAVGQWDVETDYWRGRPLDYYVDPGYGGSARAIFAHTPEMLEFFSSVLGYEYVWPKYAQIIVKDFVSGAMENTTAVVFGDFVQFHAEDRLEEGPNDGIVAHELFHHWFGDLVTCESWANLTLNEGFANYAEYLWAEHKYGRERADVLRLDELQGYYSQASYEAHPLIRYYYEHEDRMFDAHSYNKGGLVLHMLRDLVGDEAFFASLRHYLRQHAYSAAEADDLRQAFEAVTGKDLNWFFDQWFFGKGHPVLRVTEDYDHVAENFVLTIEQIQGEEGFHEVFRLPVDVAILHRDHTVEVRQVMLDSKKQSFSFEISRAPLTVVVDPRDILLAVIDHEAEAPEYRTRALSKDLSINHRAAAFHRMESIDDAALQQLWHDSSYTLQTMIINRLAEEEDVERLYAVTQQKPYNEIVEFLLFYMLSELDPSKTKEMAMHLLETAQKPPVIYTALVALAENDIDEALHQVSHFKDHPSTAILAAKAYVYARKENMASFDLFVSDKAAAIGDDYLEDFIGSFARYLSGQSGAEQDKGLAVIDSDFFLRTSQPDYRRFYLITGLLQQYAEEENIIFQTKIMDTIKRLYHKETNGYLREILKEGLGELLED